LKGNLWVLHVFIFMRINDDDDDDDDIRNGEVQGMSPVSKAEQR